MLLYDTPSIYGEELNHVFSMPLVFIVFSYNFGHRLTKCLNTLGSVVTNSHYQKGAGVIILDDGSSTIQEALDFCEGSSFPCSLLAFPNNRKKAHNLYALLRLVEVSSAIVAFVDGDDSLNTSLDVPSIIKETYLSTNCEGTLGSFQTPQDTRQKDHIVSALQWPKAMDFKYIWDPDRCWCWCHLKTLRMSVLASIEEEYYTEEDGKTFIVKGDDNLLLPRGYQKAKKISVIEDPLYIYDTSVEDTHIDDVDRFSYVRRIVRNKPYQNFHPSSHLRDSLSSWRKESGKGYKDCTLSKRDTLLMSLNKRIPK